MKNKTPMRKCAGCMESKAKNQLVRVAFYQGKLFFDKTGKQNGRGVYLCPNLECINKANKRNSIKRSLSGLADEKEIEKVLEEVITYEKEIR